MNRSLGTGWLAVSAIGGLLGFAAIPGYGLFVILSIIFSCMAYIGYSLPENKRKFLILAIINFLTGIILHFIPHSYTGGLSGVGMLMAILVFVSSMGVLWIMFKSEYGKDLSKRSDN